MSSPISFQPTNQLLEALPEEARARLRRSAERVTLATGEVLSDPGRRIDHVHFPITAVVSLVCTMENGATAEAGLVGHEGMLGIPVFLGVATASHRTVVQVPGTAWRLTPEAALEEFRRGEAFQRALLRYAQALMAQLAQTAACNRLHPVGKRLSRWLLLTRDRVRSDEIAMTQEYIAQLLGVRREGITAAARRLQAAGLIRYTRGHIQVVDRAGLEAETCECYRVLRSEFECLRGPVLADLAG